MMPVLAVILGAVVGCGLAWLGSIVHQNSRRLRTLEASLHQLISDVRDIQDPLRVPSRAMSRHLALSMYGQGGNTDYTASGLYDILPKGNNS